MAIGDSFNIREAKTSQSYAYKCWYNYNYGNNTMGISSGDIGKIITTWKDQIPSWKATAEKDENRYEIDDTGYNDSKKAGKNHAKDRTGYDGKQGGQVAGATGHAIFSVAGAAGTIASSFLAKSIGINAIKGQVVGKGVQKGIEATAQKTGEKIINKAGAKIGEKLTDETAAKLGGKAGEEITEETAKKLGTEAGEKTAKAAKLSAYIAAGIAIATATAYMIKKPNKEQKEACVAMEDVLNDSQASLEQTQAEMADADDAHVEMAEEAQATTEDGNDEIEDKKTTLDLYRAQYDVLMEKAQSGQPLSEDEKSFLKEVVPLMQELGGGINDTAETVHDDVSDIYEEMSDNADEVFNAASETMGEVEGVTDFAESFDDSTRTMCYVEAGSQTLNAASGAAAGAKLFAGPWWNWVLGGAAIAAAGVSGLGAAEQVGYAKEVGDEIHLRRDIQDLNANTSEVFDERVDDFDGYMSGIEDLTIEMPKDLEEEIPTEEVQLPTPPQNGATPQSGTQDKDDKDKDKKV